MQLTVLGLNGPFPAAGGATSGYLVHSGDDTIMMDLGSGTLGALTALTAPEALSALLFTHWHSDHCSDALPLMYRLQATDSRLTVFGPEDPSSPVYQALMADSHIDFHPLAADDSVSVGSLTITAYAARHPVPALMYRVTDGERTLCYTGDTNTVPHLVNFAADADLLLADGLFPSAVWSENKPHLSAALCGEVARDAHAARLLITHLNPFIDQETLLREAREEFPKAELAVKGQRYIL